MGHLFLFLIGFGLAVTGGVTLIAYMNFLPAGVSWAEYFLYVGSRFECYLLPIGVLMMTFVIYTFPNRP
ncbi:hypothetical protein [Ornithinibacillus scapharcae]|uniref:hypothetical protein n=1 Tax=Ornithinibacillus scapharcae TaxID=1147159 RepID=UPI000225B540|nr:hypothetical protein [Ornithinibacillus scapharcae]